MQKISKSWVSPFISALGCYFAIAAFICTMKLDVGIPIINFTLIDILGDFSNSFPTRLDAKIDPKSIPGEPSGHPKSSQNRSRDPLGTPSGAQERAGSDSGAPWKRHGRSRERPESPQKCPSEKTRHFWGAPGRPGVHRGN